MKLLLFLMFMPLAASALITDPMIQTNKKIQPDDLKFMNNLFHRGKMIDSMECEIKVREAQEVRRFKDESKWTESLELNYRPYRYGDALKEKIVISTGDVYGSRITSSLSQGHVEEFRIELNDSYNSFIEFSHDGKGNLTGFVFGDINRIYPCKISP